MKPTCIICGEKLKPGSNRLMSAFWHFRPLEWKQRPWFRGTLKRFGISAAIGLMSPLYNTLRHWKYRKAKLTSQFCALDDQPSA
ncbi:MAG: hypothetical protein KGL39_45040 [Patescibacteria group bacterium]|nr:hypothetical protein [Patescibacteria group bacterium]